MQLETTFPQARARLSALCHSASDNREVVIIHRRSAADVVLIAADELSSLRETAHLLRSPRNAERLLTALARAGEVAPSTTDALCARGGGSA